MAKRKKKRRIRTASQRWKDKADDAWSEQVRQIGRCEICGCQSRLNAHHLINRIRPRFRHDLENGICLCVGCHTFGRNGIAAHGSQDVTTKFAEWMEKHKPEQWQWLLDNRDDKRLPDWSYEEAYWRLTETQSIP